MRLTTYLRAGQARLALVDGDKIIDFNDADPAVPPCLKTALAQGVDLHAAAQAVLKGDAPRQNLADVTLAPTVPEPGKIICLGLNYFDHAKESGREKPDYPWIFFRGKSSLVAHGDNGLLPKVSQKFDYEGELALVIGTKVPRHAREDEVLRHVFGYSCFNDMSVRDYQKRTPQWTMGKNFDGTGGFGPVLVTADELPAGAVGLSLQTRLNGQVMQDANTRDMIWSVSETLALLSECLTLEPGDVVVMGTPAGVGQSRVPPVWMKAGDTVEVQIEGIGTLTNPIRAEA